MAQWLELPFVYNLWSISTSVMTACYLRLEVSLIVVFMGFYVLQEICLVYFVTLLEINYFSFYFNLIKILL